MPVAVHHRIEELDPAAWDHLAGADVLASHGWLRTVEATSRAAAEPRYVVLRENGRMAAAAICAVGRRDRAAETLDDMLFGRLRPWAVRLGGSVLPALTCGPPAGYGGHLLIDPVLAPDRRRALAAALLDGVEAAAHAGDLTPAFVHVLDTETELTAELGRRGYLAAGHVPLNCLDLTWSCFEDYLSHLDTITRDARKDIRRHVNQNRKRGVEIERIGDPGGLERRLHELLDRNSRRHNRRPFGFRPPFFTALHRNLGRDASVYVARKDGAIIGVSVMLARHGVAHLPMVGVDHELAGNDFTYFNVAHYRPIQDAIAAGMRRMYFGRALYELKRRRGCRVIGLSLHLRPAARTRRLILRPWLRVLAGWNRHQLPPGLSWSGPPAP